MNKLYTGIFILLFLTILPQVHAASYTVAPGGNDANAGTTASPWKTIQKCATTASAGDTCTIRGGSYNESVTISKSGTATAPITFTNYTGEKPIIDGQNARQPMQINTNVGFVNIIGLTFANSNSYAMLAKSIHDIQFKNCEVSYSQNGGLVFLDGSNVLVDGCNIHHTNQASSASHEAVSFQNIQNFEIKNSQVHDNGEEGIDAKYNARNGKIDHNEVYNNGGPNIYIDSANSIDIYNNDVHDVVKAKCNIGFAVEGTWNANKDIIYDINLFNNIVRNKQCGISIWVEDNANAFAKIQNLTIAHNLFYNHTTWGAIYTYTNVSGILTNMQIKNNIFWKNGSHSIYDQGSANVSSMTIDKNIFNANALGSGAMTVSSVGFVDEANANFHLTSGSPARDAGLTVPFVTKDFDGSPRPQGTASDIGPFEFGVATTGGTVKPSDANGDGAVDGVDYTIWLANYLKSISGRTNGDFSGDGLVNGVDYVMWLNAYSG